MKKVILHPTVMLKVDAACAQLPHALLLSGVKGVGLRTIAYHIANNLKTQGDVIAIEPDEKGTISIDKIRQLYTQTRTKQDTLQITIIDDADSMGHEAQNALLKLLEEPSSNTAFILTTHASSKLLPTIHSRLQELLVQPIAKSQTEDYLTELGVSDVKSRAQVQFIAPGLPAEIYRLQEDEDYFKSQAETAREARHLLSGKTYEKLLIVQKYSSNRVKVLELLQHAMHIVEYSLTQKANTALAQQLEKLLETEATIRENANTKIQLLKLVISA